MDWRRATQEDRFAEAVRRIAEARSTGSASLDLGDLGLAELPASLARLTELQELHLCRGVRNSDSSMQVDFSRPVPELASFGPISSLRNLRILVIEFSPRLQADLAPLAHLVYLERLYLSGQFFTGDFSPLAGLRRLSSLEIGGSRALEGDLAPLAALERLSSLSIGHFPKLAGNLAPLARLPRLTSLRLAGCPKLLGDRLGLLTALEHLEIDDLAGDWKGLAYLTRLRRLRWSSDAVTEDLTPLATLAQLRELELRASRLHGDLVPLGHLEQLESLRLISCYGLTGDLAPLGRLSRLRTLDLWTCRGLTGDLAPLAGLVHLESLTFSDATGLAGSFGPLATLGEMRSLRLQGCPALTGDFPLLTELRSLRISRGAFTGLSQLTGLAGLRSLLLSSCKELQGDLAPLASLRELRTLSLQSCPGLAGDLTPLSRLASLEHLSLESCSGLTGDLAPLAGMSRLKELEIIICRQLAGDLVPLGGLTELEYLDLYAVPALTADLSPLAHFQHLTHLSLFQAGKPTLELCRAILERNPELGNLLLDAAEGVPSEILSKDSEDNCRIRLQSHLADLAAGAAEEKELKLILLGNGRVGKTQLCRRLRGHDFDPDSSSTHGIELWRQPLILERDGRRSTYFVNWWDFGGQDIYHSTHALFLRSRAVFLVLWTPELENTEEFLDNGVPMRNQPLAYWLAYLRSLAGPESPVVVVQSRCDEAGAEQPPPFPPEGFDFVRTCSFSAASQHGRETLMTHIGDAIRYLFEKTGDLFIGAGRARLRRRLFELREGEALLPAAERRHRTLDKPTFAAWCENEGLASPEDTLAYFHQTGVVFYQRDLFDDRIVIDQAWALDAVYALFNRLRTPPALAHQGSFTFEELADCWPGQSTEEGMVLLRLMLSCAICFPQPIKNSQRFRYIFPDLLPPFEQVESSIEGWREDAEVAALGFEYRFLHQAMLRTLIARMALRTADSVRVWKYGLWLRVPGGTRLLIQTEARPGASPPGAGVLWITAQGPEQAALLASVEKEIERLPVLEKPIRLGKA